MPVIRPITELFHNNTTQEEIDAWLDDNLENATFEELTARSDGNNILHFLQTKEEAQRVLNAMENKKASPLTVEEVNPKNDYGNTALQLAQTEGQTRAIQEAMENAATARGIPLTVEEVNPKNNDGTTALHLAETEGQTRAIQKAMENAAIAREKNLTVEEVNPKGRYGYTALQLAETEGQELILHCAIRLAEINEHNPALPALEEDAEKEALNNMKENGYNLRGVSAAHLESIKGIFLEFSKHIDQAILNRNASGIESLQEAIFTRVVKGKLLSGELKELPVDVADKIAETAEKYGLEVPEGVEISRNAPMFYNIAEAILKKTNGLSITGLDLTNSLLNVFDADKESIIRHFDIKEPEAKPDSKAMASNSGLRKLSKALRKEKPETAEELTKLVKGHIDKSKDKGVQR